MVSLLAAAAAGGGAGARNDEDQLPSWSPSACQPAFCSANPQSHTFYFHSDAAVAADATLLQQTMKGASPLNDRRIFDINIFAWKLIVCILMINECNNVMNH